MPAKVSYNFGTTVVPYLEVKPGEIKDIKPFVQQDTKVFCSPNDQASGICFYDPVSVAVPKSWPRFLKFLEPQKYRDGLGLSNIRIVNAGESLKLPYLHLVVEHLTSSTV